MLRFFRKRREVKNLRQISKQLRALDMRPIAGPVEQRLGLVHIRAARTHGTFELLQTGLAAFGVIAAAYAIAETYRFVSGYLMVAALLYLLLVPTIVARRGRRAAVRAILDHRINRAAVAHEARCGLEEPVGSAQQKRG